MYACNIIIKKKNSIKNDVCKKKRAINIMTGCN